MHAPRYPNIGQDCESAKHETIRMASFAPNIINMKKKFRSFIIILIWIALWQLAAVAIQNKIIFVGPWEALQSLSVQIFLPDFWLTIFSSWLRIALGFSGAFLLGILLGSAAGRFSLLREFLEPVVALLQSVPVASFVILALIWIGSKNLSVLITFLVVFPVIYRNVLEGIRHVDQKLLEMAQVFRFSPQKKVLYLYRPALMPYLQAGCHIALGMAWKSGIAAEVIGVPAHSIGEKLYMAKIYLSTAELFAWTFVIIIVSKVFEKLFLFLLDLTARDLKGNTDKKIPKASSDNATTWKNSHVPDCKAEDPWATKSFSAENSWATKSFSAEDPWATKSFSPEPVRISHLWKSYGNQNVLMDVSFNLTPGTVYCLLGPSGCGKTTFLRLIMNLEAPRQGSIRGLTGQKISAVFQEDRLFDFLSPLKNVHLACEKSASSSELQRFLEQFLEADALSKPVSQLSGGMKRRAAIARALAAPSDLIIMDEPFTGLDEATRDRVIHLIQKYLCGRTLLLVTHQEEDVEKLKGTVIRLPELSQQP